MKQFVRGQKSKLASLTPATTLEVGVLLSFAAPETVKISCFGVDLYNRLSDQDYFILYDQQRSPEGAVAAIGRQVESSSVLALTWLACHNPSVSWFLRRRSKGRAQWEPSILAICVCWHKAER